MIGRVIYAALEWIVMIVIFMLVERAAKLTWRTFKTLKNTRSIRVIAVKK